MLATPPSIQTGAKGGRFVETASGRRYLREGEEPGHGHAAQPEQHDIEHAHADKALQGIKQYVPPDPAQHVVEAETLKFKDKDGEYVSHGYLKVPGVYGSSYTPNHWQDKPARDLHREAARMVSSALNTHDRARVQAGDPTQKAAKERDGFLAIASVMHNDYLKLHAAEDLKNGTSTKPFPSPLRAFAVQKHFDSLGLGREHHETSLGWVDSSASPSALRLHGALQQLGVAGSLGKNVAGASYARASGGSDPETYAKEGAASEQMKTYARKMYSLSQAALRDEGIKEVVLRRGFGATPDIHEGDHISMVSRPASSWTSNPDVAHRFASRNDHVYRDSKGEERPARGAVAEMKVPVDKIYTYHGLFGNSSGEDEYVVLGAQTLPARIRSTY